MATIHVNYVINPVFGFYSPTGQVIIPYQVIHEQWTFFPPLPSNAPAYYTNDNYNVNEIMYELPLPLPSLWDALWVQQDEALIVDGESNVTSPPRYGGREMEAMMIMKNLKTRSCCNVEAKDGDGVTKVCAVCQEDLCCGDKEEIGVLDCGHEYHARCIRTWLVIKNVCPLCNATAVKVV